MMWYRSKRSPERGQFEEEWGQWVHTDTAIFRTFPGYVYEFTRSEPAPPFVPGLFRCTTSVYGQEVKWFTVQPSGDRWVRIP